MVHHPPTVSHRIPYNPTVPLDPMPQETLREPHSAYSSLRVPSQYLRVRPLLREPLRDLGGTEKL